MDPKNASMHVSHVVSRRGEKEYHSYLVRRSYREGGKVKHETVANVSKLPPAAIQALTLALSKKTVIEAGSDFEIISSKRHGASALLYALAKSSGLLDALGKNSALAKNSKEKNLVLAMIISQALSPSSKLASVNYLSSSTLADDLGISDCDVNDYYSALDWLLEKQTQIESSLIKSHLSTGSMLLYDLSSSYMEGTKCPLAHYGYSRDKKRNKLQIEYGVITTKEGLPLGVKVFNGNTSDLASFRSVIEDIKTTHKLEKLIVVGDRGMFSTTNIAKLHEVDPSYLYVSALRSQQIRALVESDAIQLGLFDDTDLFEITHSDYQGERLIVCKNQELAQKRHQTRQALLEVAKTRLDKLRVAVSTGKVKTEVAIGRRIEAALRSTKMNKHIITTVSEGSFDYQIDEDSVSAEAAIDGIYVIRTTVSDKEANSAQVVEFYKNLTNVERVFRSLKSIDINVRPVRHYLEKRVRAHVFLCVLSAHLLHFAKDKLAPLTFRDTERPIPTSPVAKKVVSDSAKAKGAAKVNENGEAVTSLRTLFLELDTLARNTCRIRDTEVTFEKTTSPTERQRRAFELIGAKIPL